jgi:hypothetical protein
VLLEVQEVLGHKDHRAPQVHFKPAVLDKFQTAQEDARCVRLDRMPQLVLLCALIVRSVAGAVMEHLNVHFVVQALSPTPLGPLQSPHA